MPRSPKRIETNLREGLERVTRIELVTKAWEEMHKVMKTRDVKAQSGTKSGDGACLLLAFDPKPTLVRDAADGRTRPNRDIREGCSNTSISGPKGLPTTNLQTSQMTKVMLCSK